MSRAERERQIIDEAVQFFAEVGFEGQTRALAERLGVTQPLLYRYFPSKEHLIDRVYQEVYLRRWNPDWETLIQDRAQPLPQRLKRFYRGYAEAIFTYEWVRIFMFAGLKGVNINARYAALVQDRLIAPLCAELRAWAELPTPEDRALTTGEKELCWALHGGFFYIAIRKFIYNLPVPEDLGAVIDAQIDSFLGGAPEAIRRMLGAG